MHAHESACTRVADPVPVPPPTPIYLHPSALHRQVGAEYAVSLVEQERQVEALTILEYGLASLQREGVSFEGLAVQLYHPDMCPVESFTQRDEAGNYRMKTSYMKSYVADDGTVHLVADSNSIKEQIYGLDLERARMLSFVSDFWLGRVKELTPAVQKLLGVKAVWCDTKTEQNSQKFVIWAGYLLERRWVGRFWGGEGGGLLRARGRASERVGRCMCVRVSAFQPVAGVLTSAWLWGWGGAQRVWCAFERVRWDWRWGKGGVYVVRYASRWGSSLSVQTAGMPGPAVPRRQLSGHPLPCPTDQETPLLSFPCPALSLLRLCACVRPAGRRSSACCRAAPSPSRSSSTRRPTARSSTSTPPAPSSTCAPTARRSTSLSSCCPRAAPPPARRPTKCRAPGTGRARGWEEGGGEEAGAAGCGVAGGCGCFVKGRLLA